MTTPLPSPDTQTRSPNAQHLASKFGNTALVIAGALLSLALIASSWIIASHFKQLKQSGSITVKGLAEAPYTADLAQMQLGISSWGADYATALSQGKKDFAALQQFVANKGFAKTDQHSTLIEISPYYEDYMDENGNHRSRQNGYSAVQTLSIHSKDLKKITDMLAQVQDYRTQHSEVTFDNPQYLLSNLEQIKHELIGKATEDANKRAQEFAKTGNAKVGVMRSASQGSFNILNADNPETDNADYGGTYDKSTTNKLVRLVVTIDYSIEQ